MSGLPKQVLVVAILAIAARAENAMDKRDEEVRQYQVQFALPYKTLPVPSGST